MPFGLGMIGKAVGGALKKMPLGGKIAGAMSKSPIGGRIAGGIGGALGGMTGGKAPAGKKSLFAGRSTSKR